MQTAVYCNFLSLIVLHTFHGDRDITVIYSDMTVILELELKVEVRGAYDPGSVELSK